MSERYQVSDPDRKPTATNANTLSHGAHADQLSFPGPVFAAKPAPRGLSLGVRVGWGLACLLVIGGIMQWRNQKPAPEMSSLPSATPSPTATAMVSEDAPSSQRKAQAPLFSLPRLLGKDPSVLAETLGAPTQNDTNYKVYKPHGVKKMMVRFEEGKATRFTIHLVDSPSNARAALARVGVEVGDAEPHFDLPATHRWSGTYSGATFKKLAVIRDNGGQFDRRGILPPDIWDIIEADL